MGSMFMRYPGGKKKALTLSYDNGVEQDIRLIELMKKNGLKGTFNLNSGLYAEEGTVYPPGTVHRRMTEKMATEVYGSSGMEVAVHGLTHPFLEQLPVNLCTAEVIKDRENLEKQFQTIVRGMAYPFGTTSDMVVNTLMQSGIAYARTTVSTGDFRLPSDWLRLTATCHHKDGRLKELAKKFENGDSRVIKLSRLRYVKDSFDKGPIVLTTSYMPESDAFLFDYDFTKASLTKALNDHSKNRFSLEKEMTARPLESRESHLMGMKENALAMLISSVTRNEEGQIIEISESIYPLERNKFVWKLKL